MEIRKGGKVKGGGEGKRKEQGELLCCPKAPPKEWLYPN